MRHRRGNIFLVGPMGAGKSTIGKQLAKQLKMEFFDTDQQIEARTGAEISWIFDVEGEDGFRIREAAIVDELTSHHGIVLATGGGVVLQDENRARLAARGTVVYLLASVEQQVRRTARDKKRPLLQNVEDRGPTLENLMIQRDPLYQEIADIVIETNTRTVRSVANDIIKFLEQDEL